MLSLRSLSSRVTAISFTRTQIHIISRAIIVLLVAGAVGTLFWQPAHFLLYAPDILLRTYLMFLGTVMAHEGVHGNLGRTKAANFWWGRLALVPTLVPFTNFRKTHHLHHAHTNEPEMDPDHFVKPRHPVEIPFRAVAMPHQWIFWLRKRMRLKNSDYRELVLNYLVMFALYAVVLYFVGPTRLLWGMLPALVLVSILLWYPFAIKTHEGFSTGSEEARSHNYYGWFMYWFSLGLSMHREHHLQPRLSWVELAQYVEEAPADAQGGPFQRDIRPDREEGA